MNCQSTVTMKTVCLMTLTCPTPRDKLASQSPAGKKDIQHKLLKRSSNKQKTSWGHPVKLFSSLYKSFYKSAKGNIKNIEADLNDQEVFWLKKLVLYVKRQIGPQ